MGMLDRYKKSGGFLQLLILMETCGPAKQEKFFQLIDAEDKAWSQAIRTKMLTIDRIMSWPEEVLFEIFTRLKDITVATARHGIDDGLWKKASKAYTHNKIRLIDEIYNSKKPNSAEVTQSFMQIITEVRDMVKHGHLRLERIAADLHLEEDIEDRIEKSKKEKDFAGALEDSATVAEVAQEVKEAHPDAEKQTMELTRLRQRVVTLDSQNREMKQELSDLRLRLDRVKKIVA